MKEREANYASKEETNALITPDMRTAEQKKADKLADKNWANEQGIEPQRKPLTDWIAVSDRIPLEADGEVLVRMRDGRCEIAWATYWHGASNAFAQWTFRDPDEDEVPTHWMHIPTIEAAQGIKEKNT